MCIYLVDISVQVESSEGAVNQLASVWHTMSV